MTATLVTLALTLSLSSAAAPEHGAPSPAAAAPSEAHGGQAPAAHDTSGHAAAGQAAAGEHGDGHGGGHDESLGAVMMHHVTDGYVIEHPGICHGGFAWNCELDLKAAFGDSLKFGALDMTPTKHVVMMWIASALLLLVVFAGLRRKNLVPRGLYNFVETLVAFVRNEIAIPNIGKHDADRFVPYLVSAFFFILFLNLFGLVPFAATATANLSVTVMMALFTFVATQWAAIRAMGVGGYFAHLTGGVPASLWPLWFIMIPVEALGLFTKPFALTVRLFANMVAGHFVILALLGLIFALGTPLVAIGSVPMALAIFLLELFVAFVQAYIFTMLSSLFIGAGLAHHGEEHGHEEHAHAGPGMGSEHGAHGSHVAGTSPGHG
jgi:F-type H+-transporting ATPase subunit a